jgi:ABC-2 type transport system ATP-binding protein
MKAGDAKKAAERLLDKLEASEYIDKRLDMLSKGNQQKIQLISTLIHDPQLIFLDEPFSGLDPLNAQMFHELISDMANNGKTIIMSSHQMATVEQYCREITLLHRGNALVQGNLADIKRGYGHTKLVLSANAQAYNMAHKAGLRLLEQLPNECVFGLPEHNADAVCEQLLRDLLAQNIIPEKFVLSEPTLHEIFIDKVSKVEGGVA